MKNIMMETAQDIYVDCQKVLADVRKHGGGMTLLKQ